MTKQQFDDRTIMMEKAKWSACQAIWCEMNDMRGVATAHARDANWYFLCSQEKRP